MEIDTSLIASKALNLPPFFCSKHGNAALSLCFSENCSDPVLCLNCFGQIATSASSAHKGHNLMQILDLEAQIKQTNEVKFKDIESQYEKLKENLPQLVKNLNLYSVLEIGKSIFNEKNGLIEALHKEGGHNIVSMVKDIMRLNRSEETLYDEAQKHFDQVEAQLEKIDEGMSEVRLFIKGIQSLLANSVLSKEWEEDKTNAVNTNEFGEVHSSSLLEKITMSSDKRSDRLTSPLVELSPLYDPMKISDVEHPMDDVENNADAIMEEYSDNNHGHNRSSVKNSQLIAENEDVLEKDSGDKVKTSQYDEIPTVLAQLQSLKMESKRSAKKDAIEEMEEDIVSEDSEEEDEYKTGPKIIKKRGNPTSESVMIGSSDLFGQVLSTNAKSIKCLTKEFKTSELKLLDEKPSSFTIAAMGWGNPSLLFTSSVKSKDNDKVCCFELNQSLEPTKLRDVFYRDTPSEVKERIKIMTTIRFRTKTYMVMLGERVVGKSQLYLVKTNGIIACKMVIDSNVNCMDYFHEYLFLGTGNGMKIYQIIITSSESISLKRSGINLESNHSMKDRFERQGHPRLSRFHILQSDRENSQDGAFNIHILCHYSTAQMLVLHILSVTYSQNNWVLSGPCSKRIDTDIELTCASKKHPFFIGFGSTGQDPDVVYCFTKGEIIKLNFGSPERCPITKLPNIVELQDFKMITLNRREKDKKGIKKNALNIKFILLDVDGCLIMDYVDNEMIVKESKFKYDVKWDNYFPKAQLLFRSSQDFRLLVLDKNSTLQEILLEAAI